MHSWSNFFIFVYFHFPRARIAQLYTDMNNNFINLHHEMFCGSKISNVINMLTLYIEEIQYNGLV